MVVEGNAKESQPAFYGRWPEGRKKPIAKEKYGRGGRLPGRCKRRWGRLQKARHAVAQLSCAMWRKPEVGKFSNEGWRIKIQRKHSRKREQGRGPLGLHGGLSKIGVD